MCLYKIEEIIIAIIKWVAILQRRAIMIERNDLNVNTTTASVEFLKDSRIHVAYASFYIPPGIHEKDMNVCIASRAQLVATNMKVIFNLSSRIERERLKSRPRKGGRAKVEWIRAVPRRWAPTNRILNNIWWRLRDPCIISLVRRCRTDPNDHGS